MQEHDLWNTKVCVNNYSSILAYPCCCIRRVQDMTEEGNFRLSIHCHYPSIVKKDIINSSLILTYNSHTVERTEINLTLQPNTSVAGDREIRSSPQIEIRGGQAECGGDGFYKIILITPTEQYNDTILLELETKTEIHMEIGKSSEIKFQITCSSSSKCRSNSGLMTLFVYGNKRNGPIRRAVFECNETYDLGIWRVNCNGSFSKHYVMEFREVGCRLHLINQTETGYIENKMSTEIFLCNNVKGCNFQCPEEAHNGHYLDESRCYFYHRCVNGNHYWMPCGTDTYFSTTTCNCDHKTVLIQDGICKPDGSRRNPSSQKSGCGASTR